jgi:hypothetical protein
MWFDSFRDHTQKEYGQPKWAPTLICSDVKLPSINLTQEEGKPRGPRGSLGHAVYTLYEGIFQSPTPLKQSHSVLAARVKNWEKGPHAS